ncbi:MAG: hypothetical protein SWK76_08090 [Actinomycetota bacterium]|nr:hypothetical protein [Actinomycetota bacterium]
MSVMSVVMNRVLTVFAVIVAVSTVIFIIFYREEPPTPSGPLP